MAYRPPFTGATILAIVALVLATVATAPAALIPAMTLNEANTGPRYQPTQTVGSFTADEPGAIYEGLIVEGSVDVTAPGVTLRDVVFLSGGNYAVKSFGDGSYTAEYVEADGLGTASNLFVGADYTVRNSYIHSTAADAFRPYSRNVIEGNYITNLGLSEDAHADAIQTLGAEDVLVAGNFFDLNHSVSRAIIWNKYNGQPTRDVTLNGNYFYGSAMHFDGDVRGIEGLVAMNNVINYGSELYDTSADADSLALWSNNRNEFGQLVDRQGNVIPEPTAASLIAVGLTGLMLRRNRFGA